MLGAGRAELMAMDANNTPDDTAARLVYNIRGRMATAAMSTCRKRNRQSTLQCTPTQTRRSYDGYVGDD